MSVERTLILLKPDAVKRGLSGDIISRFEKRGLRIAGMKMLRFDEALARRHYAEHVERDFFPSLLEFVTSGPVVAMALEGADAVLLTRTMMGATNYTKADPGTIRGDYAFSATENLVHGSDSPERAIEELAIFFNEDELY